jgi:hypothetical protein
MMNPFFINVGPGVYIEPAFSVPSFTTISGSGPLTTTVQAASSSGVFITLSQNVNITQIALGGASDPSGVLLNFVPTNNGLRVQLDDVSFANSTTVFQCIEPVYSCSALIRQCGTVGAYNYDTVFKIQSSTGSVLVVVEDGTFLMGAADVNDVFFDVSGTNTTVNILNNYSNFLGSTNGTHIKLYNGATLDLISHVAENGQIGLSIPNVGTGPKLRGNGLISVTPVIGASALHPGATGAIQAIASASSSTIVSTSLSIVIVDPNGNNYISGTQNTFQPSGFFTDVTTLSTDASPLGLLSPGAVSFVSGTTVSVTSGTGYLQKVDGSLVKLIWPTQNIVLSASSVSYLYFDYTNTLHASATMPNTIQNIFLARVVTDATIVTLIDASGFEASHAANSLGIALRGGIGAVFGEGCITSEVGTRQLNISSGSYYFGELNYITQGANPASWIAYYQNGSGGFTEILSQSVVDNAFWDSGTGTLAALGAGNYAKHSVYALGTNTGGYVNEAYFLVYSQQQYASLTLAEQGSLPNPPSFLSEGVTLIASTIVQQGTTHIVEILDERPITNSKRVANVAASTYHHNLLGLNDFDDHLRYLPVDGSRAMAADLPMGSFNINSANTVNAQVVNVNDIALGDSSSKAPNTKFTEQTAIAMALIFG